ncbi:YafY family protein [Planktotalea sp.]|uniref:helix-turn-helix transcriptional regulator n=1 Tax=Planktotalea sp. TaxID=2029877 RepID=UPI0025D89621|nr:YafY family protein [Planktotalea sp.]
MSRTARLFQLMQAMRQATPPVRAEGLAFEMGVSLRTIYRDIDSLRSLGAVIDGEAGYRYTLIEDATLPPLGFDDEEIEALVLGLREVGQTGDPSLAEAASRALSKLKGRLPPSQAHRLEHAVLSARRFRERPAPGVDPRALRQAEWDEVSIAFAYVDKGGAATSRSVDPLGITSLDQVQCLLAFCHLRQDFRVFRLDRMQDLVVSADSFRPKRVPMLRDYMERIHNDAFASANTRSPHS